MVSEGFFKQPLAPSFPCNASGFTSQPTIGTGWRRPRRLPWASRNARVSLQNACLRLFSVPVMHHAKRWSAPMFFLGQEDEGPLALSVNFWLIPQRAALLAVFCSRVFVTHPISGRAAHPLRRQHVLWKRTFLFRSTAEVVAHTQRQSRNLVLGFRATETATL